MNIEEKKPRKFLKTFLLILITAIVTAILVIIILSSYIIAKNPFNIKACIISSFLNNAIITSSEETNNINSETKIPPSAKVDHPLLSNEQEKMMENAGIDVSALPTNISPEMEKCFIEKLGEEKVEEIINGAVPGPLDIFKAKSCL